jgi:ribosome-associated translation inhibitor RaiA
MQIQVNTDHHIDGHERMNQFVSTTIADSLKRFEAKLTRVEVHFHDENGKDKHGDDDIRCVIEARPRGLKPITVKDDAGSVDAALGGAIEKLERALEHAFGKLQAR